ncbi:MAG: hypothetical protein FWG43_04020, partial [Clostridiales bacterium]|nr:hypothetical protein [Clostridiales bacterium]
LLKKAAIGQVNIKIGQTEVGGGSLPTVQLSGPQVQVQPTYLKANTLAQALRQGDPAVLVYIREEKVVFDPRTISREEIVLLAKAVEICCADQMEN